MDWIIIFTSLLGQGNLNKQSTFSGSKGAIDITYSSLGANGAFYFQDIIGGGDYIGKGYYYWGLTYVCPLTKSTDIETDIS
ncbi:MAG: hypothetical protein PHC39_02120 [Proteiniphilum sp.]|nr:hypothetical protein [Proteiniphilum sp.]MDD3909884.1 hypothetical protein [Proteiniphilum sp.]